MKTDTIQKLATELKLELEEGLVTRRSSFNRLTTTPQPVKVKLSHCYELIAAAFGYGQHVSMKKDDVDWDDQECYIERWRDDVYINPRAEQALVDRIKKLDAPELKRAPSFIVTGIVQATLAPACKDCGRHDPDGDFVHDEECNESIEYVCQRCAKDEDEYGTCRFCGNGTLYPTSLLNSAGECPVHKGESYYSEEELEDLNSYVEYLNNH
ncbi:hypothetical protein [Vibrio vulnificus]|uniref:hypothetical protein n=1 Tax=Vibrio vulnificus TaxID=672 RepID=UPI000CD269FD|nr:hypothetical protein [Vibrio vulnificus]POC39300.1 hypothetical protein CRN55_08705 [Vibrio vulnificus]